MAVSSPSTRCKYLDSLGGHTFSLFCGPCRFLGLGLFQLGSLSLAANGHRVDSVSRDKFDLSGAVWPNGDGSVVVHLDNQIPSGIFAERPAQGAAGLDPNGARCLLLWHLIGQGERDGLTAQGPEHAHSGPVFLGASVGWRKADVRLLDKDGELWIVLVQIVLATLSDPANLFDLWKIEVLFKQDFVVG